AKINVANTANSRLDIQPYVNDNGDVVWLCGNADAPLNALADPGDGTPSEPVATTVADKYMPASCRTDFGGN
ncbi:MAG TPA: hypothetical protein VFR29_03890, partial [Steroidobacteraceae bacterium]|nr:hypothetical protein [Steroidobacteraceae bacterium]